MRVSCIIPAYNASPYLERAVDSLLATNCQDLEIIIVDDGSHDGTQQLAHQLAGRRPGVVRALGHPGGANRGVSRSRNLGIEQSRGELLCFLDADDFVHSHRFESAFEILGARPDIDGVHQLCELVFSDDSARGAWWSDRTDFGFPQPIEPDELIFSLLRGQCWATSAIVFRRSLLERTGLFDPRLAISEDCHLWFRMAVAGRLVSGDLSRPVSAYWRHGASAYQPQPEMRVHMISAMTSFERWMAAHFPHDPRRPRVRRAIAEYILQGIAAARTAGRRKLAWSLALGSLGKFPALSTFKRYYGHLARMAVGR